MPRVRAHLTDLVRIDSADTRGDFIRLDRNERVSPLPEDVWQGMLATMHPRMFSSYPDPKPLTEAFATAVGLPADHVVATNGSDAAIRRTFQAFIAPGDTIAMSTPTYTMYAIYARIAQAGTLQLKYAPDLTLAPERWHAAVRGGIRMLCLVNPDNPTGAVLPRAEILAIVAAAAARDVLCLVDEAYYPCHRETVIDAVRDAPNLIVTRSLSKAYGLGGLRVGFACAQPSLIAALGKVRGLHEVNAIAVHAGSYMLARPHLVDRFLAELEAGRSVLVDWARGRHLRLPPCPTNYQLIALPDHVDPDDMVAQLRRRGFLVRGFREAVLSRYLRITLDAPDLMRRFVEACEDVMAGADAVAIDQAS
jgi:histidinol-phosphate aminotransferase